VGSLVQGSVRLHPLYIGIVQRNDLRSVLTHSQPQDFQQNKTLNALAPHATAEMYPLGLGPAVLAGARRSGVWAVYVFDRKKGTWYAVDFEDKEFGGYNLSQLEMLLKDCNFLDLMERPGLWRTGLRWVVSPGMRPEAGV
jgi:hypothetical protein